MLSQIYQRYRVDFCSVTFNILDITTLPDGDEKFFIACAFMSPYGPTPETSQQYCTDYNGVIEYPHRRRIRWRTYNGDGSTQIRGLHLSNNITSCFGLARSKIYNHDQLSAYTNGNPGQRAVLRVGAGVCDSSSTANFTIRVGVQLRFRTTFRSYSGVAQS